MIRTDARSFAGTAFSALLAFAVLCPGGAACAKTIEEIVRLPVEASDAQGRVVRQEIVVTVFRESTRKASPFLILNHGRPPTRAENAAMGRVRFSDNAKYFVGKGFVVFVPTRIGYGVSGGPDVENSGSCRAKKYLPVYEAAAQESLAVIAYAKTRPYVDAAHGVVLGQSFGGTVAITLAAKNIPGVFAAVNFAGGGGGNPVTQTAHPCGPDRLTELFAGYGETTRIPTLWLYSENDKYFGKELPQAWFKAFRARGGNGGFVELPPHEPDGHKSFTGNPDAWRPAFEKFLATLRLS